jgi:CheY-like chemotaxis protein
LIVDDEPFNLLSMKILLDLAFKDLQYPRELLLSLVDTAKDGAESIQLVREAYLEKDSEYALIISDCQMPICDGYEATEWIREFIDEHHFEQPVIVAVTGNVEQTQIDKAFNSKFDEVVAKPATINIIKAILKEVIVLQE